MIKVAPHTQVQHPQQHLACHLSQKSRVKCSSLANSALQTLDELDAASMRVPGKQMKISWMILSRVGVEYLTGNYKYSSTRQRNGSTTLTWVLPSNNWVFFVAPSCGRWTVCQTHRREFLDAWQVGKVCCHPKHVDRNEPSSNEPKHLVNAFCSLKLF